MAVINGTNLRDILSGTELQDVIRGLAGNDDLFGLAGDDTLVGGAGADRLDGGTGLDFASYNDSATGVTASLTNPALNAGAFAVGDSYFAIEGLIGSRFDDTLIGDDFDNILRGGLGADQLFGGFGIDIASYINSTVAITASLQDISLNTGEAAGDTYDSIEVLSGSRFADTLYGTNAGTSILLGNAGGDTLIGSTGFDYAAYWASTTGVVVSLADSTQNTGEAAGDSFMSIEGLIGSAFSDQLVGDAGDNWLDGGGAADLLNGGDGYDTVSFDNAFQGVILNLTSPSLSSNDAAGDSYLAVEEFYGSTFADTMVGNGSDNQLLGGNGNDTLFGAAGDDWLDGGLGNDVIRGGAQTTADGVFFRDATAGVVVNLSIITAQNTVGSGIDTIVNIEKVEGSRFGDRLTGSSVDNLVSGLDGNDVLDGAAGDDWLFGGEGNDTLIGGTHFAGDGVSYFKATTGVRVSLTLTAAQNTLGAGIDTLSGIEFLEGSEFADRLFGSAVDNRLWGLGGNDTMQAGAGNDFLNGGAGDDAMTGGMGSDEFWFGLEGVGTFGNDVVNGFAAGAGGDFITLEGLGFTDFASVLAVTTDLGSSLQIDTGSGTITLANVADAGLLDASNFILL